MLKLCLISLQSIDSRSPCGCGGHGSWHLGCTWSRGNSHLSCQFLQRSFSALHILYSRENKESWYVHVHVCLWSMLLPYVYVYVYVWRSLGGQWQWIPGARLRSEQWKCSCESGSQVSWKSSERILEVKVCCFVSFTGLCRIQFPHIPMGDAQTRKLTPPLTTNLLKSGAKVFWVTNCTSCVCWVAHHWPKCWLIHLHWSHKNSQQSRLGFDVLGGFCDWSAVIQQGSLSWQWDRELELLDTQHCKGLLPRRRPEILEHMSYPPRWSNFVWGKQRNVGPGWFFEHVWSTKNFLHLPYWDVISKHLHTIASYCFNFTAKKSSALNDIFCNL